jgi:hypothetical protein
VCPPDDDHVGIRRSGPKLAEQQTIGKLSAENYPAAAGQAGIAVSPGADTGIFPLRVPRFVSWDILTDPGDR